MSNTVIQLKFSAATGNTPTALANGELAINTYDGKIFYRGGVSNTIQSITRYTGPAGLDTELQFNDAGSLGGSEKLTFDKTTGLLTVNGTVRANIFSDDGVDLYGFSNNAFNTANAAFAAANNAISGNLDQVARDTANAAFIAANNATSGSLDQVARDTANGAFARANTSLNVQSGGTITGNLTITGNITTAGFIGINTNSPDSELNILGTPQTVSYPVTGNSTTTGTDLHISGADGTQTRITQDSFGTSQYVAFTGRAARGTAASPTQTQSGDTISQFTGRGFSNGTLQFGNNSSGRVDVVAAENFTDTSRATNVSIFTTATGSITPAAVATFTGTGANITGSLSVSGNVSIGGAILPRLISIADGTSVNINVTITDIATQNNTQVAGTLTINAPTGTSFNGQKLIIRLQSANVQTFSWNGIFAGSTDLSLPTTSSGSSKYDYVGFIYNTPAVKWQLLAKNFGF